MPNDTDNPSSSSLLGSITRMLDATINAGAGPDNLISVLALLCLFSIVNKNNAVSQPIQTQSAASNNPLHKLLGDLTKGGDGGSGIGGSGLSPDTLMSLLPLLNSPQLKSKLNPSTMGTVLGLLNNLGGGTQEKPKPESKPEPKHEPPKQSEPPPPPVLNQQPAPALKQPPVSPQEGEDSEDAEGKNYGRYLNWKNNF
ncbi:hypothetical protein [Sporomusa malonica]|uniref:Uncharacterized protein n=1 Tax=Sporomusa malonica TaxID=112901 RepID=A0A1W2DCT8_9FIRM|nr:hypothetical protein [Sporomusa malonica]SMC94788.1 hypothetical protein SAMN04488500_114130 [Sporomusa malonica]